jgi:phosphatidylinositol alpha-1,6-mannosyltransferase
MERFDLVICGHVNLLPLAHYLNLRLRAPMVLLGYGIDVWSPPPDGARRMVASLDAVWVISAITRERMNEWAKLPDSRYVLMPNAIHLERYGVGAPGAEIVERHGLRGRKVIMTLARLSSFERYKGIDEVLEVLPGLVREEPTLTYLIAGDGDDRDRLERKCVELGVRDHVVFTGFVREHEKADYFRAADAFVMPGRGEGFGFVFLEALACGIPVVGSQVDGSREALRDGELGQLVDPSDPASVAAGILKALAQPREVPPGLSYFAWPRFRDRVAGAVQSLQLASARTA